MVTVHDLGRGHGRGRDQGQILYATDFDQGLGGWDGLKSGSTNTTTAANMYKWPTLTTEASAFGRRCLKLDAGVGSDSSNSNTAVAIRRTSLFTGRIRWSMYIAHNGLGENWLRFLRFVVDTQDPRWTGGSKRFWFELRYSHYDQDTAAITGTWKVETGTVTASVMSSSVLSYILPFNEWQKVKFHKLELIVNTTTMAYESFTINGLKTDLSSYSPTADTSLAPEVFDNGLNTIMYCQNRSNNSSAHSWGYLDKPTLEWLA